MEVVSQVQRRKACDLCFTKKIKCDMLKPTCSNCQLYKAQCRTTAVRRRIPNPRERDPPLPSQALAPVPAPAPATSGVPQEGGEKSQVLEDRLARIEAQLQQVLAVASSAITSATNGGLPQTQNAMPSPIRCDPRAPAGAAAPDPGLAGLDAAIDGLSPPADWFFDEPCSPYKLAPIEELLPRIDIYFNRFNSVLPLFDQGVFMQLLHDFYHSRSSTVEESRYAIWAAVNIVIALSYRVPGEPYQEGGARQHDPLSENENVSRCLQNAQSVLNELVTREEDLLGLQSLLGMVIIFQSTGDQRPSPVLIGTAVRLAHHLRVESRRVNTIFSQREAQQRTRVFWIAYLLDKDISVRHQIPSVQQDDDIDVDLPPLTAADGAGDLYSLDGRVRMNFFRSRVQLASIQGRIYQALYSTRSGRMPVDQRGEMTSRIENILEEWRRSIPAELQLENVVDNVDRVGLTHMAGLHHAYLLCLVMIHGVYSPDAHWITGINNYSRLQVDTAAHRKSHCRQQAPPMRRGWARCVAASRSCLRVMERMSDLDCSMWLNGCAFISALIIMLVHLYEAPRLDTGPADRRAAGHALDLFRRMKSGDDMTPITRLDVVIEELNRRAIETARAAAEDSSASSSPGPTGGGASSGPLGGGSASDTGPAGGSRDDGG